MSNYTIEIKDNKIIFNGHAEDRKSCEAITNICNSLSATNNIIEYTKGYAEFEINKPKELNFAIEAGSFILKTNDGAQTIYTSSECINGDSIVITENNIVFKQSGQSDQVIYTCASGDRLLGISKTANMQSVDFGLGTTTVLDMCMEMNNVSLYLVIESDITTIPLYKGENNINSMYKGNIQIKKMYKGSVQIF